MTREEAAKVFGFDPESIGIRHRHWWINEEEYTNDFGMVVPAGALIVEARDGAANMIDAEAFRKPNYLDSWEDWSDPTYRYYVYTPLEQT